MKLSRYNNFIIKSGWMYAYNSLVDSSFKLPLDIGIKLKKCLESPDTTDQLPSSLIKKLTDGGFLVRDDFDELSFVKQLYKEAVESKDVFLSILPTMNCNYNCWYCYQDHVPSMLTDEAIQKVKLHIDYLIDVDKITSLRIDWFGGEPLMYFAKVVKPLSEYILSKCKKAGIQFVNSTTTNAYFINKEIIRHLEDLNFELLHVTLDGCREFHNKVKFHPTIDSAFDHTLHNLNEVLKQTKKTNVLLRINYTGKNLKGDIVKEICDGIAPEYRNRVRIYFRQVWQDKETVNYQTAIRPLLKKLENNGFSVEFWSRISNFVPCYTNRQRYVTISPNGDVLKCTAHEDFQLGNTQGIINSDGKIIWDIDCHDKKTQQRYLSAKCTKCSLLPSCMGPCPKTLKSLKNNNYCKFEDPSFCLNQRICDYVDSKFRKGDNTLNQ